ncbi:putative lipoprotein YfhM [Ascidiaceihabitans donghaensis]|uniref:Putative lipoprotein YfhM n=1 Tax=Ascidiaceihabitans donghaensis TaxID=1510460 RepID=A0A2R8B9F5_9RHOB|nr:alpha-2-macroglobulin family protein [Ascidiaceihabitans donghaensis]SPH19669.1 putative lipoprotein YfhM [Ascidiaceihabitans donghaensis]
MRFLSAIILIFSFATGASSQDILPDERYIVTPNVDFYGSDRASLFDTTQQACARACSADSACVAYTFNSRSNACFPKSDVSDRQPYDGAMSAEKIKTTAQAKGLAAARLTDLSFVRPSDLKMAEALARSMGDRFPTNGQSLEAVVSAARSVFGSDRVSAYRRVGAAVAFTDASDLWAQFAYVGRRLNDGSNQTKRQGRRDAIPAAVNAYLRAASAGAQVNALQQLAFAYEANNRGKDMIAPLRLAYDIQPREEVSNALDEAINKYGFRIIEHTVENRGPEPQICAVFSEELAKSGVTYGDYVRIDGDVGVTAKGRRLCVEGVQFGSRYQVTFRAGLPDAKGEKLVRDVDLALYVRDRDPQVRFPGRSYVLPRGADAALPVETVNLNEVTLQLRRVSDRNLLRSIQEKYFGKPLSSWQERNFSEGIAQDVWSGTADVQNTLNADMTTRLPMGDVLGSMPPGIYTLTARVPGQNENDAAGATQWFVLSDLGLTTWQGNTGLTVSVRGLSDAQARAGVEVSLISKANAVLAKAVTDADGFATFAPGLSRGSGASAPALIVAQMGDDDIGFLPLTDPAFDLSDRGVAGRPPAPPVDVFLTTDRGAYRPGDTIFATALLRDAEVKAIAGMPLTAILTRPDGVEYSRHLSADAMAGGHVFEMPVGGTAPRGTWRLSLKSDLDAAALASQTVLVEDFLPERIDASLSLPDAPIRLGDRPPLTVDARYLFGAPGGNLAVEGDVRLRALRRLDAWPGYQFGRHDLQLSTQTRYLEPSRTDDLGRAVMELRLPDGNPEHALYEAQVAVRVTEGSGRPIERRMVRALDVQGAVIGIKPLFEDVLNEGADALFELVSVGGAVDAKWTMNRVRTRYQWYQLYGDWNWEPIVQRTEVASGSVTLGTDPVTVAAPTEWGEYELVVETSGGAYTASSVDFYAGWYGGGDAASTPDRLDMSLDAESYELGDTATLRLVPRYDGSALVAVMSGGVIERRVVDVKAGENTVPLTVSAGWGAGAYVTATVIRPMDVAVGQNPARALGVAYAKVAPGAKALSVSVDAGQGLSGQAGTSEVRVKVDGITQGETAYVTLASVDLGILNLTGFDAPDPDGHYFGQRRLGVEMRDVYGRLIDGLNGAMGQVRSGGDAVGGMRRESPPPTEDLMAAFSGPVAVDSDGFATFTVPRPDFNGTIRMMAVAWSDTGVGAATQDVVARDPMVMTASVPRFMAPGDVSRLLLQVVHAEGAAGQVALNVSSDGLLLGAVPAELRVADKSAVELEVPVTATLIGDYAIDLTLITPDGVQLTKTLTLGVRANDPEVSTTRRFSLGVGEAFTFDGNVFAGLMPGTARATLAAGPLARFDVPGLMRQLDRYPYGCTEQLTSGALPLLAAGDLAGPLGRDDVQDRVDGAIAQILTRQSSNGAFGMWRAGSGYFWLDAYVTDFLSRAKAAGYVVPKLAFDLALDNLRNRVNYAPDFDEGGEDVAYALFVLAREGAAAMGDLRYYADAKATAFGTPLAAAQLGAALAQYGDQTRSDAMFGRAGALLLKARASKPVWRDDFGTNLRDTAGVLRLAAEVGSTAVNQVALSQSVSSANRTLSTQEAAQVVMAAQALSRGVAVPALTVDDVPARGTVVEEMSDSDLTARVIRNVSGRPIDVTMTTFGVPDVAPSAGGYGYAISREYFTLDGVPVSGDMKAGERRVVVLRISPFEAVGARLIVDDPLPAGLEIDNPNLIRAGDIGTMEWLKPARTQHAEFRSDRFLAAVDQQGSDPFVLAYIVRAVSPGTYHHPAALVQDMYRPEYRAVTQTGRISVVK